MKMNFKNHLQQLALAAVTALWLLAVGAMLGLLQYCDRR